MNQRREDITAYIPKALAKPRLALRDHEVGHRRLNRVLTDGIEHHRQTLHLPILSCLIELLEAVVETELVGQIQLLLLQVLVPLLAL